MGVDLSLPLVKSAIKDICKVADTPEAAALMAIGLLTQLTGWAFATLFVAGFTGAVRKT
ncbi:MAG: hypothetical protein J2P16_13230 [Mycobacterium sp.]|nr:hypothetical protein [Mycobacterium sp.]